MPVFCRRIFWEGVKMEIRELTADDLESLLELYVQLDESNKNLDLEKVRAVWKNEIENNKNIKYYGVIENGKVIATCYTVIIPNLTAKSRPICFVENVVTDVNHRKQGLARKVLEKAVETAKQNNCYKVILQSGIARKEAHRFYENFGFNGDSKKAFDLRLE